MQSTTTCAPPPPPEQARSAGADRLVDLFTGVRLTPVQRRIAAHIVEQGPAAAFHSSVELAAQVGVSQPSVTRLATALGYTGFAELQRAIRALVVPAPASAAGRSPARANTNTSATAPPNKLQLAVKHAIDALAALQTTLVDPAPITQAAATLAASTVLPVYGARSSAALAAHFAFFAAKIHPDVRLLKGADSELQDQLAAATAVGAESLLVVALPRYPRELLTVLGAAHQLGLRTVLLADSQLTSLTGHADMVLAAPVASDLVFDTAIAPLQLLTILLEAIADVTASRTRSRLERFEQQALDGHYFLEQS